MVTTQNPEIKNENMADATTKTEEKPISLEKIIRLKNAKTFERLPRFVFNMLRRFLKEDTINDYLIKNSDKRGLEFINKAISDFNIKIIVKGLENIPDNGRYIFVCNHPLGAFDGFVLFSVIGKKYKIIKAIVNDILMLFENFQELFIPVNSFGASSKEYIHQLNEIFDSDAQIAVFPAGEVSRIRNGVIADADWQKSFIGKAISHKRDIVPIHMEARNSKWFYRIAKWRKSLGIKANIELLMLPREIFTQENKTIHVTIGPKIPFQMFNSEKNHNYWAQKVREDVYNLAK